MKYIRDLKKGDMISEVYLCKNKLLLQAKTGKSYFSVVLQDKTGTADGKVWDVNSHGIEEFDVMDYIFVSGEVVDFQGALQIRITRIRKCQEGEYDIAEYMPVSEKDLTEMYKEIETVIASVKEPHLHTLLDNIFLKDEEVKKSFQNHSAAKAIHHGFIGGLLEHTTSVVKMCAFIASNYPVVNRDLLLAAAMLHDIGKLRELSLFPNNDYTDEGQLLGHIYMGAEYVQQKADAISGFPETLKNELLHCILAHHGELEFGSPKKPALVEAIALSFADNLDAKMEAAKELFAGTEEAGWLGYQRIFDSNMRKTKGK